MMNEWNEDDVNPSKNIFCTRIFCIRIDYDSVIIWQKVTNHPNGLYVTPIVYHDLVAEILFVYTVFILSHLLNCYLFHYTLLD